MIDFSEFKLFEKDGKPVTYQDLLQDIYTNSEESKDTMKILVDQLITLVDSPSAAVALMAHINSLMESKIKNDDLLVKVASIMARIIQKGMSDSATSDDDWGIGEEEKKKLLEEAEQYLQSGKTSLESTVTVKKG